MTLKMLGRLIVFEGVEGAGKTTQLRLLQEWLPSQVSHPIVVTREPGGTQLGLRLRQLLLELGASNEENLSNPDPRPLTPDPLTELLLYAADRAQHVEEVLKPQLASGAIVLCDRYTDSTTAYQGYGRGLNLSLIAQLNKIATGGLESDLTLWLDVDVEISLARVQGRGRADRIEQETALFHRRVQQGYIELAKAHPHRIIRIDASLSEAVVQQQIQDILFRQVLSSFDEE